MRLRAGFGRRLAVGLALAATMNGPWAATGLAQPAIGFIGKYDAAQPIYLVGTVVDLGWGERLELGLSVQASAPAPGEVDGLDDLGPVVALKDSPLAASAGQVLSIQLAPIAPFTVLARRLHPGDRIAVIVLRDCSEPHKLVGQWLKSPDGGVIVRPGKLQTEVAGCR